jgi:protein gp37
MGQGTIIAWTNHTFNVAWGCTKVSPGCKNCYADSLSSRYGHDVWGPSKPRRTFGAEHWKEPLKWNAAAEAAGERARVFCSSMCDIAEDHPQIVQEMKKLWPLIRRTPWLDWQLLTKRPERYEQTLPDDWGKGYANVWLGTSIENNDYVWRADELRKYPATVRFISYEPALGPLDKLDLTGIDWVIYGGESGAGFRGHNLDWPRDMKRRCEAEGIAFFYKQSAAYRTEMGTSLDGETVRKYPTPRLALPVLFAGATNAGDGQ